MKPGDPNMPSLSFFPAAVLCALLAHGVEASTTPSEASEPAALAVEKPPTDTSGTSDAAGNPQFPNANPRYPGKSLLNAYGWMLLGTAIPVAAATAIPMDGSSGDASAVTKSLLFFGGFIIGPSAGQFYAGSYGRGALAVAVRTAGFAMVLRAMSLSEPMFCVMCGESDGSDGSDDSMVGAWFVGGIVVYAGGLVYSMFDQEKAVERYNAKLRGNGAFGWTPTLVPGPDGSLRTGATAWMRF
jgi:hypothetical protein